MFPSPLSPRTIFRPNLIHERGVHLSKKRPRVEKKRYKRKDVDVKKMRKHTDGDEREHLPHKTLSSPTTSQCHSSATARPRRIAAQAVDFGCSRVIDTEITLSYLQFLLRRCISYLKQRLLLIVLHVPLSRRPPSPASCRAQVHIQSSEPEPDTELVTAA